MFFYSLPTSHQRPLKSRTNKKCRTVACSSIQRRQLQTPLLFFKTLLLLSCATLRLFLCVVCVWCVCGVCGVCGVCVVCVVCGVCGESKKLNREVVVLFPCSRTTYCGGWPACCCCKYCSSANLMPHLVIFFMYLPTHKSKQVSSFEFRVLARNDVTHLLKHISAISLYRRSMSCICSVSISLTSAS